MAFMIHVSKTLKMLKSTDVATNQTPSETLPAKDKRRLQRNAEATS
jgi:hypothetical protein